MLRSIRRRSGHMALMARDMGARKGEEARRVPQVKGEQALRASLLLLLVAALTSLFPTRRTYDYPAFREGEIAHEEAIAPETFPILKNEAEYAREVDAALNGVPPVLAYDVGLWKDRNGALDGLFTDLPVLLRSRLSGSGRIQRLKAAHPETAPISESTFRLLLTHAASRPAHLTVLRTTVQDLLEGIYRSGVMADKAGILEGGNDEITLVRQDGSQGVNREDVRDLGDVIQGLQGEIERTLPQISANDVKAVYELIAAYLSPNLVYDHVETEGRRKRAAGKVSRVKGTVLRGERIVNSHDRITPDVADKLRSLATHMSQQRKEDPYLFTVQIGARAVLSALMMAILFGFLALFRPGIYRRTSSLVLFGIFLLMPALVAYYADTHAAITPFLVPIALSAMLATVLFDAEVGLVVSLITAALCSSILGSLQHAIVFLITGVIGSYSVRKVLARSDFYRSIVYLIAGYTAAIMATGILLFNYASVAEFLQKVKWDLVFGSFTACACSILTIGLLPIFESVFNVVTPITLLELSDLNRPLLRNLAIRAPGTYSHSIILASLSEAAAEAIGADRLLVRVGCYYHDIGKMIRPHYFVENQKDINPHDELQPKMSALILISHVKEGMELAREEGLPRAIIELIPQHHGTGEIASFMHRALERGDKQAVRDEDFQYPGPRPQTKEAGIINLADAVESATRTLSNNSPDRIKGMVQTIVKGRFTSGELDECDLTLRDLTMIQEAFLPILQATRHSRILYPWQEQQQRELRDRRKEKR